MGYALPSALSWDFLSLAARVDFEIERAKMWEARARAWEARCEVLERSLDADIALQRDPLRREEPDA